MLQALQKNCFCKTIYWRCMAVQKEIEAKGKYVSILLKLCEHLKGTVPFGQNALMTWDADRVRKVAKNLEHRWHAIWLQSLERQYILEELLKNTSNGNENLEKSFSEEPLRKYPRLGDHSETIAKIEDELKSIMNLPCGSSNRGGLVGKTGDVTLKNDKAIMVGSTGIAELKAECSRGVGKFEIIQDIGYSSETSAHLSMDEKPESIDFQDNKSLCRNSLSADDRLLANKPYLAPDKYPSVSLKTLSMLSDERPFHNPKRDCCKALTDSFYKVACIDDDVFEELNKAPPVIPQCANEMENSSKAAEALGTPKSNRSIDKYKAKCSLDKEFSANKHLDCSTQRKNRKNSKESVAHFPKVIKSHDLWKKSARVCEWLNTCHSTDDAISEEGKASWSSKAENSSCDASGECTTAESDSEKSNVSDVNNSVTLSQSFTGSIETVIPAKREDVTSNSVRLRKKKRSTRDRPWSVIELNQSILPKASFPHSTSEGALDLLGCSHESSKNRSQKLHPKSKRLSLSDISNLCSRPQLEKQKSNPEPSNSLEHLMVEKKDSVSDQSSDNPASTQKDTLVRISKCIDTFGDVQVILSDTTSLPKILDPESGCGIASAEDQFSISDQAWDEYQDPPYLSEPYSEQTVDEDEVRRVTSFGDDYRAVLGSYSDASSVSLRPPRNKMRTRTSFTKSDERLSSDSNSDSEDFHHILETSTKAFHFVSNSIQESTNKMSCLSSEFAELVATCQTNLCHLKEIATAGCELESVSKDDVLRLKDLIKAWEDLETRVLVLSRGNREPKLDLKAEVVHVHSSLALLKEKLSSMAEHARDAMDGVQSLEQVSRNIHNLQASLSNIQEMKETVLSVSARILRLIADGGHSLAPLKDTATKLYQQWEDVYELNCSQLTKLQNLQSQWAEGTEDQLNDSQETTVQWQPVQVGNNLPKAEVSREALHMSTAAEVQVADEHNVVFEIEDDSTRTTLQCLLVGSCNEELQQPLLQWNLPVQRLSAPKLESPAKCTSQRGHSCLWRALRAALPIQCALVVLYCLSCFLEPQCCEHINTHDFSILPKLHFPGGPPPV
ncbi:uncharacterized protein CDAR_457561 [Caerostris darwini]|uniref:KASH domain-containing protein n=1 Tax=Caerostris darwini TaxID=1538125 RepID=A0AAV4PEL0_9ARAC|nr:uncharacterized protein CDAR_457561 [Caerostris darwini]